MCSSATDIDTGGGGGETTTVKVISFSAQSELSADVLHFCSCRRSVGRSFGRGCGGSRLKKEKSTRKFRACVSVKSFSSEEVLAVDVSLGKLRVFPTFFHAGRAESVAFLFSFSVNFPRIKPQKEENRWVREKLTPWCCMVMK